jgi:hypothetical protein
VIARDDAPNGYVSVVHQGALEVVTILKAPHRFVLYNMMAALLGSVYVSIRCLLINIAAHGVVAAITWYDPHLLMIWWRHLRQPRVYRSN